MDIQNVTRLKKVNLLELEDNVINDIFNRIGINRDSVCILQKQEKLAIIEKIEQVAHKLPKTHKFAIDAIINTPIFYFNNINEKTFGATAYNMFAERERERERENMSRCHGLL